MAHRETCGCLITWTLRGAGVDEGGIVPASNIADLYGRAAQVSKTNHLATLKLTTTRNLCASCDTEHRLNGGRHIEVDVEDPPQEWTLMGGRFLEDDW